MPRNAELVRAFRFLQLMQRASVRPTGLEIADAMGVSVRTARRWIAAAAEAHVPMPPSVDQHERASQGMGSLRRTTSERLFF